jgi:hypothetical protein
VSPHLFGAGSPHLFGAGSGKVSEALAKRVDKIARKHDAAFYATKMPEGWRYWFVTRNWGEASNRATASAVQDDLRAAGIELP